MCFQKIIKNKDINNYSSIKNKNKMDTEELKVSEDDKGLQEAINGLPENLREGIMKMIEVTV